MRLTTVFRHIKWHVRIHHPTGAPRHSVVDLLLLIRMFLLLLYLVLRCSISTLHRLRISSCTPLMSKLAI